MAKMTREEVKERSLRDFRSGRAIDEICKEYGVAERSLYMWNNVFGCVLSQCGRDEEQAYKIWIKMKRPRPSAKEIELLKTCDEVRREIRVQDDMFRECVMLGLVQQYHEGKSVTELSKESGIARSTIYYWIKRTESKKKAGNKSIATQKEYEQLLVHSKRFSKAGVPYDNSVMESFFASMKREELYRYKYRSEKEFRARVDEYINFYNCKRPHKTLKYKTPEQAEQKFLDAARG